MVLYESFVTLILAVALVGGQPISQDNGPAPTFDEFLKRHNIQLTKQGLVDALRNTEPEVRYLAAHKLAEDKAVNTGYQGRPGVRESALDTNEYRMGPRGANGRWPGSR